MKPRDGASPSVCVLAGRFTSRGSLPVALPRARCTARSDRHRCRRPSADWEPRTQEQHWPPPIQRLPPACRSEASWYDLPIRETPSSGCAIVSSVIRYVNARPSRERQVIVQDAMYFSERPSGGPFAEVTRDVAPSLGHRGLMGYEQRRGRRSSPRQDHEDRLPSADRPRLLRRDAPCVFPEYSPAAQAIRLIGAGLTAQIPRLMY